MEEINKIKEQYTVTKTSFEEVAGTFNGIPKNTKIITLEFITPDGNRTHSVDVTNLTEEEINNLL